MLAVFHKYHGFIYTEKQNLSPMHRPITLNLSTCKGAFREASSLVKKQQGSECHEKKSMMPLDVLILRMIHI